VKNLFISSYLQTKSLQVLLFVAIPTPNTPLMLNMKPEKNGVGQGDEPNLETMIFSFGSLNFRRLP